MKPSQRRQSGPLLAILVSAGLIAVYTGAKLLTSSSATAAPTPPPPASATSVLEARLTKDVQPLLQKYCYNCHGNGKHKGDTTLDKYANFSDIQADRPVWESVLEQCDSAAMPPEDKPQPSKAEMSLLISFVHEALSFRDCNGPRDPGKVTIRRLNRAEYNNTIRDLLGVDVKPAADFPSDDTGYGFDNIADVLSMSPLLAEKYLYAAEGALDKAIVTEGPKRQTVRLDGVKLTSTVGGYAINDTAWVMGNNGELYTRQEIPGTGQYEIRARVYGQQVGADPVRMAVRIDGQNARVFEVTGVRDTPQTVIAAVPLHVGEHQIGLVFLNEFTAKPEVAKADAPKTDATKPATTGTTTTAKPDPQKAVAKPGQKKNLTRRLIVENLVIDGPTNAAMLPVPAPTEFHKKLIFSTPSRDGSEQECAKKVIEKFTTRAFRRPATPSEVTRLMALFTAARTAGDKFDKALKTSMAAVLCSPHFLFRIEPAPAGFTGKAYPISDYALASRLSYFLWSTMPDDELFAAAAAGKLRQPGVIDLEIKRMMADPKAQAFVTNFEGQWLELRILDDYEVDAGRFPAFRPLRQAMKKEVETYFQSLITENGSILDLIDSNYTFVNEKLAAFYGITGVTGDNFRKVPLTSASHRGGVLTMAGVLTVTAMPSRTSPVKRGKFVLEQILGTPPPPPPPDVPALSEKQKDVESASMRKRLEAHRADPTCASCHKRMDPIGFALENYNAIGQWRDKENDVAIDPSGVLPGGHKIAGPEDLKKALMEKKDGFVRCLATKMLTYAIGRGVEPYDQCTIDDICAAVKQNNYRFSSLMAGIVKSDAFQKRRTE